MGIRIRPIKHTLTARAGLVAVNQLMRHHAQLPQILDTRFPMRGGSDSAVSMSYISLLCQGITPFDAIENLRQDRSFGLALGLPELPPSPTVRQRIESRGRSRIAPLVSCGGFVTGRIRFASTAAKSASGISLAAVHEISNTLTTRRGPDHRMADVTANARSTHSLYFAMLHHPTTTMRPDDHAVERKE